MLTPLLATKFFVPAVRRDLVPRPRLLERLDEALHCRLALVSAPAGFGKTTLLSEWLATSARRKIANDNPPLTAWLSLDEEDNDLVRFFRYLISALSQATPGVIETARNLIRSPQLPPSETILTTLINELCSLPTDLVLVLEDYHTIHAPAIHAALAFLIDNMPPRAHLVISTRADPPLPLSRWRSRGMMVEIRADDLRLSQQESGVYLNEVMNLRLESEQVTALSRRTEGWIVGLQMAALALQGKSLQRDASAFIQAFSGSHHYILDYLVEEVLAQQPRKVHTFLLHTSILARFTGPLCDAVTGGVDGQETLEFLDTANLFLVPLDDERRWYRYHHLFADVLRARLQRAVGKEGVAPLHASASTWFENHGEIREAFRHAVTGNDFDRATRLIEENWLSMGHAGEMNVVLHWLESMPEDVVRSRPMLSAAFAWVLWLTGQMEEVEPYLDAAGEAWERQAAAETMDPDHVRWQAGGPALRTNIARHRGQLDEAIHFARQTLSMASPDDALLCSYGHLGLAHTYRELGDYEKSRAAYVQGIPLARAAGNIASANINTFYLCRVLELQGHLHQAAEVIREALGFAEGLGMLESPACAILHIGQAGLLCEWNELSEAQDHLQKGQHLGRLGGHHEILRNAGIVLARLRLAQGDPASALEAIHQAEQVTIKSEMALPSAELAAHKARVRLAHGDLAAASRWAEEAAQRAGQDRGYTRQIEAITLARVSVARDHLEQALGQLAACQQSAEVSGGFGWAVEIGILSALSHQAMGHAADALADLERALARAEPEGYVQVFLDEGEPMVILLRRAASTGVARAYARRLLDIWERTGAKQKRTVAPGLATLIEPLTEREMEVLHLMVSGLSNREIAEKLVLAMGTVKAHLHNIYGKLGVKSRVQAAARARELHLL